MRRREVRFSADALGDLAEIFEYLAVKASPSRAERYVDEIMAGCERIGEAAEAGRTRSDLRPGLRSWALPRKATIFYAIQGEQVLIARIFHRGRSADAYYRNLQTI